MASKAFWTLSSLERAFAKAKGGKERRRCGGSGGLSFRCFFFGLLDAPPMAARARSQRRPEVQVRVNNEELAAFKK